MKTTPHRILVAGWIVFLLYAYPGYMQTDGADQLADSRVGEISDWHSPMMTELWRIVGCVLSGPAGMLCLQSLLMLAGSYHLLRRAMSDRAAAFAAIGVLLFPAVLATTALVSAEAQLAAFLIAGAAALASDRRRIRFCGLALIVVACGMRAGAALAALPIVFVLFRWHDESSWRRRGIAIAAWVACVILAAGITRLLVDVRTERNEVALAMSDIVGTLCRANAMTDAEIREVLGDTRLPGTPGIQERACKIEGKSAAFADGEDRIFENPDTEAERSSVISARLALARAAPGGYLVHRGKRFLQVLGLWSRPPLYTELLEDSGQAEGLRHRASHSNVQEALIVPVRWLAQTPLLRPYVYFIVALILLPLAAIRRQRVALMLLASAIAYEVSLMFVTLRATPQDSHWMIAATVLSIVMLSVHRFARDGAPGRPS